MGQFDRAKQMFLNGVEAERKGQMFDAIQFYRRSIQLVPDIEFMLFRNSKSSKQDMSRGGSPAPPQAFGQPETPELPRGAMLEQMVVRVGDESKTLCEKQTVRSGVHISQLPAEVFEYILRWVASSELDMRSVEMMSVVCVGFYVAVRRSKIWEDACLRLWGVRTGPLDGYLSWREMFVTRPHVWFHGIYISKMSYVRNGEQSFQDQFYRPWHLVTYYRYLRFFPDGTVLMLTTPDEPAAVIPHLKNRNPRNPQVLAGSFKLIGNGILTGVLFKNRKNSHLFATKRGSWEKQMYLKKQDLVFLIDLKIDSYRHRFHGQLGWKNYEIISRTLQAGECRTSFDLSEQKFPNFYFSRVKSYMVASREPFLM